MYEIKLNNQYTLLNEAGTQPERFNTFEEAVEASSLYPDYLVDIVEVKQTKDYFFCYSPNLKGRLLDAGLRYICVGKNESTGRNFWLFEQSPALSEALSNG